MYKMSIHQRPLYFRSERQLDTNIIRYMYPVSYWYYLIRCTNEHTKPVQNRKNLPNSTRFRVVLSSNTWGPVLKVHIYFKLFCTFSSSFFFSSLMKGETHIFPQTPTAAAAHLWSLSPPPPPPPGAPGRGVPELDRRCYYPPGHCRSCWCDSFSARFAFRGFEMVVRGAWWWCSSIIDMYQVYGMSL